jgi:HEAT repeat protein
MMLLRLLCKFELIDAILRRVTQMKAKWFYVGLIFLFVGCAAPDVSQEKPAMTAAVESPNDTETIEKSELARQLRINQDALIEAASEERRIDAACLLLFNDEEPMARDMLLDAIKPAENINARVALCKALSQGRSAGLEIDNKTDFLEPLLDMLTNGSAEMGLPAAEASLIFDYEQISKQLQKIVTDSSLSDQGRLNAIGTLKLQPDMSAVFVLLNLCGDPKPEIASAAEKALLSLGIPTAKDEQTQRQIIEQLKKKGRGEFLRDWLVRQEIQISRLETRLQLWRQLYLVALDKIYNQSNTDELRAKFLIEQLNSSEEIVRLWALERVSEWRMGTKSKLPAEMGPVLLELVSDANREIRLKTARLLSLMGKLDSTAGLLQQIKLEKDAEVRTELFVALGGACYYAFLPNSTIKVPMEVRMQVLELAAEYVADRQPQKAQKGADVIEKLLEQNGLPSATVKQYFKLLSKRYQQEKESPEDALRAELLGSMAGLCAQSVYKTEATRIFRPLFSNALHDENNLVREAAVDGLIYIDKTNALGILRKDFSNDENVQITNKLIKLADEVGNGQDLPWLAEKLSSKSESRSLAWDAMLRIFKSSDAQLVNEWAVGLAHENHQDLLSYEKLADYYYSSQKYDEAAKYLGLLRSLVQEPAQKEAVLAGLLEVYLKWPNSQRATYLLEQRLLEADLEPNSLLIISIENCIAQPGGPADPNLIRQILQETVVSSQERPKWSEQVKKWLSQLSQPAESGDEGKSQ